MSQSWRYFWNFVDTYIKTWASFAGITLQAEALASSKKTPVFPTVI